MPYSVITRPDPSEYTPYYETYIKLVAGNDVLKVLQQQLDDVCGLLASIPPERADTRYGPGKWSIKEVIGHVIDTERIFGYRALRFARGDRTPLPGFEQDDYVRSARFGDRGLDELAAEFQGVRQSNLCFFTTLDGEAWSRRGVANGVEISVRALAYLIAGHERHHMEILRSRYLG